MAQGRNASVRSQEYLRVSIEQGRAVLQPAQSSGARLSATWSDGFLELPVDTDFESDDLLDFIPFTSSVAV
ncbi:hypothetical protein [Pseudomonas sp. UM16]|uniref:hypothetical protein n=1 Tax=Pseudomonas sp. UM16 TaxID=3158962 RepID=UPI003D021B8E